MRRIPDWIRLSLRADEHYKDVQQLVSSLQLNTVCESARCPNRHECWNSGTATVMILGNRCTRDCRFCSVESGPPHTVDATEPDRVARAAEKLGLKHVVITSVTRDDLPDGGAQVFADTIAAVKARAPLATVEVLTPDFGGDTEAVNMVLNARPDVFNHNLETVKRLQVSIRPSASYTTSLSVLTHAASHRPPVLVKTGLMLGLGETEAEVEETMRDLHAAGCRLLTLGQYLQPDKVCMPVQEYITPQQFERLAACARAIGFSSVKAGPLVRSSYEAESMHAEAGEKGGER